MSRFQFRLSTLKKLRESHRDELRLKLGEAYRAERLLAERAAAIRTEEEEAQEVQRGILDASTTDVSQLLDAQRYVAVLRNELTTLHNQSQMLATEIEKRRQALVAADQQVRVLEKLHERQLEAHERKLLKAEVKVMDEIASRTKEMDL